MWRSFWTSPSISFETGIPVHRDTTSAMSSSSTSSLSMVTSDWSSAGARWPPTSFSSCGISP